MDFHRLRREDDAHCKNQYGSAAAPGESFRQIAEEERLKAFIKDYFSPSVLNDLIEEKKSTCWIDAAADEPLDEGHWRNRDRFHIWQDKTHFFFQIFDPRASSIYETALTTIRMGKSLEPETFEISILVSKRDSIGESPDRVTYKAKQIEALSKFCKWFMHCGYVESTGRRFVDSEARALVS